MNTQIFSKDKFIQMLQNELKEDQIIVLTAELEGTISLNKKRNVKKVTFGFAADAFKMKDDIRHFAFGKTPVLAFSVVNREDASDLSLSLVNP